MDKPSFKTDIPIVKLKDIKTSQVKKRREVLKMRDIMTVYLKEINKNATSEEVVTRLRYTGLNGKEEYVEDFSYFAKDGYMSKDLLNSLQNGQTLTSKQHGELENFVIERRICFE